jgi:uncharacterized protein YaaN involved in tellurite resistance
MCGFCFNAWVFIKLIQLVEKFGTSHQITFSSSTAISSLTSSDSISITLKCQRQDTDEVVEVNHTTGPS